MISCAGFVDRLIRQLNGAGQTSPRAGRRLRTWLRPPAETLLVLAKVVENGIDGDLARQFSGLLSAHAVADHENSVAQVVAEIVLVVLADEADVGDAGGLD